MKKIKQLVHCIKDELKDADKYYTKALLADDSKSIETFKYLAKQELEHVNELHKLVVDIINAFKDSGATVPPVMQELWDYEHEEMMLCADDLKTKISRL